MLNSSPLIVLTAPSTEMSEYEGNHAIPFAAGFSKPWFIPRFFLKRVFFKPVPSSSLEVSIAPLGIRRLEASLVRSGFKPSDVVVVHPDDLSRAVGPNTRVIGISSKDPLGLGYVSITYSSMLDLGEPINKLEFERLMRAVERAKAKYGVKVVVGGAGAWQLLRPEAKGLFDVDVVFIGEGEVTGPEVFWKLVRGKEVPKVVEGKQASVDEIPMILKPSIYGSVEISRGCGRGCAFCSPTMQRRRFMSISRVVEEVELNVKCGVTDTLLVTEDVFMYGVKSPDFKPNREAVEALFEALLSVKGLNSIQVTHANLAAVNADRELARYVAEILREKSSYTLHGKQVATVEVGVETGSPRLLRRWMAGKCKPFKPEDWPDVVVSSLSFMEDYEWVALCTILVGLPGETDEDAERTIRLIEEIRSMGLRTFLVPLIFVPLGTCSLRDEVLKSFNELSQRQIDVFALCWEHNVKVWGPGFFKSQPYWAKVGFKLASKLLYRLKYRRGDEWRRVIADRVFDALKQLL